MPWFYFAMKQGMLELKCLDFLPLIRFKPPIIRTSRSQLPRPILRQASTMIHRINADRFGARVPDSGMPGHTDWEDLHFTPNNLKTMFDLCMPNKALRQHPVIVDIGCGRGTYIGPLSLMFHRMLTAQSHTNLPFALSNSGYVYPGDFILKQMMTWPRQGKPLPAEQFQEFPEPLSAMGLNTVARRLWNRRFRRLDPAVVQQTPFPRIPAVSGRGRDHGAPG